MSVNVWVDELQTAVHVYDGFLYKLSQHFNLFNSLFLIKYAWEGYNCYTFELASVFSSSLTYNVALLN